MKRQLKNNWNLFLIASLTLGLAPFNPPHIVGKLQWIIGGNAFLGEQAMRFKDIFDVFLHGTPWVFLVVSILLNLSALLAKTDSE